MKNMGNLDRVIRTVLGAALVIAGVVLQATAGHLWWLALPGAVFMVTAFLSTCPLYIPFGISTLKK